MSHTPYTALPAWHCREVALHAGDALVALLTPREAIDLAAQLIKSVELIRQPQPITCRDGLSRFDQEFGTPLATIFDAVVPLPVAELEQPIHPATHTNGGW